MERTPVWSHHGIICTGETYKQVVKMTFAKGASLADPAGLFNSSLEGNTRRAIDFREGDKIDEKALKALIRAAVALNETKAPDTWTIGFVEAKSRTIGMHLLLDRLGKCTPQVRRSWRPLLVHNTVPQPEASRPCRSRSLDARVMG